MAELLTFVRYGVMAAAGLVSFAVVALMLSPLLAFTAMLMSKVMPIEIRKVESVDEKDLNRLAKLLKEKEHEDADGE